MRPRNHELRRRPAVESGPMTTDTTEAAATRTESDSMGAVEVPADRYWGAQTQRSLHHFAIGHEEAERMPREIVHAMGLLKRACAEVNARDGRLDPDVAGHRRRGGRRGRGRCARRAFPLYVWQTGSGTQTNMNANEVIANRAIELAGRSPRREGAGPSERPRQHVAVVATTRSRPRCTSRPRIVLVRDLIPSVRRLRDALDERARRVRRRSSRSAARTSRTPCRSRLGQEFSGYVAQLDADIERFGAVLPGPLRARDRRHRGGDRPERAAWVRGGRGRTARRAHRPAVRERP